MRIYTAAVGGRIYSSTMVSPQPVSKGLLI